MYTGWVGKDARSTGCEQWVLIKIFKTLGRKRAVELEGSYLLVPVHTTLGSGGTIANEVLPRPNPSSHI